jgi:DNA-directed RNA polymerase subunit RPC12/RpoP
MKCPKCGYSFKTQNQDKFPIEPADPCPKCGRIWYYIIDLKTEEFYCPYCGHQKVLSIAKEETRSKE